MAGRLIAVVGPSGVGKDSVMAMLKSRRPALHLVRRVITRDPEAGGEEFTPVNEGRFEKMAAAGAFALWWRAHGLAYGIPVAVRDVLGEGRDALVNLSRGVLLEAVERFPGLLVLALHARPEVLADRLAARGREDRDAIAARLAQADKPLPEGVPHLRLDNSGPLEQTVEAALAMLYPERV